MAASNTVCPPRRPRFSKAMLFSAASLGTSMWIAYGVSAPLLFTALFSNYWLRSIREPTASLSILIYNFSSMPFDNQIELAWAASLVLVLIVLTFNILSRFIGRPQV